MIRADKFRDWAKNIDEKEAISFFLASLKLGGLVGICMRQDEADINFLTHICKLKCVQWTKKIETKEITFKLNGMYQLPQCFKNIEGIEKEIESIIADLAWRRRYYKHKLAIRSNLDPIIEKALVIMGYKIKKQFGWPYIGLEEDF